MKTYQSLHRGPRRAVESESISNMLTHWFISYSATNLNIIKSSCVGNIDSWWVKRHLLYSQYILHHIHKYQKSYFFEITGRRNSQGKNIEHINSKKWSYQFKEKGANHMFFLYIKLSLDIISNITTVECTGRVKSTATSTIRKTFLLSSMAAPKRR